MSKIRQRVLPYRGLNIEYELWGMGDLVEDNGDALKWTQIGRNVGKQALTTPKDISMFVQKNTGEV